MILPPKFISLGTWGIITIVGDSIHTAPSDELLTKAATSGMVYFKYFIVRVPQDRIRDYTTGRCPSNFPITRVLVASTTPINAEDPQALPTIKQVLFHS